MGAKRGTLQERFDRYYMPVTECGCWIWLGCLDKGGYGNLALTNDRPIKAHRLSYILRNGFISEVVDVRHTCDIRCCVNPDHLLIGTRKQNMGDALARNRTARGFSLPHTKITPDQVAAIIDDSRLYRVIAEEYGLSSSYISMLKNKKRRTWIG